MNAEEDPRRPATGLAPVWESLLFALEAVRHRVLRSLLTVTGVFIGVVIIVGVASVLNGFRQGVIRAIERFGTENIYISRFPHLTTRRPDADVRTRARLTVGDVEALRRECAALQAVTPMLPYFEADIGASAGREEMLGPIVRGVGAEVREVMNVNLSEGRFFSEQEDRRGAPVCLIGTDVAKALFPGRRAAGKSIAVQGHRLRVLGVMAPFPRTLTFGEDNPDDSLIFLPYTAFKQSFPAQRELFILARAHSGRRAQAIEQIEEVLRRRRHVAWQADNDFEIDTPDSIVEKLDQITGAAVLVMFALSGVAFLVGGVGVMNVMLAAVKERTREIGIRRAIGARRREITWQFLIEAMVLTGAGGLLGVFFGEALMWLIVLVAPSIPCETPLWARAFGFAGSVGVGLLFGLWPAVTAARLDPIAALRYE